jgi:hypothetical protein
MFALLTTMMNMLLVVSPPIVKTTKLCQTISLFFFLKNIKTSPLCSCYFISFFYNYKLWVFNNECDGTTILMREIALTFHLHVPFEQLFIGNSTFISLFYQHHLYDPMAIKLMYIISVKLIEF